MNPYKNFKQPMEIYYGIGYMHVVFDVEAIGDQHERAKDDVKEAMGRAITNTVSSFVVNPPGRKPFGVFKGFFFGFTLDLVIKWLLYNLRAIYRVRYRHGVIPHTFDFSERVRLKSEAIIGKSCHAESDCLKDFDIEAPNGDAKATARTAKLERDTKP